MSDRERGPGKSGEDPGKAVEAERKPTGATDKPNEKPPKPVPPRDFDNGGFILVTPPRGDPTGSVE